MLFPRHIITAIFVCFITVASQSPLQAQPAPFNFHHLTSADGLSNGVVRAIARDKYGYIWVGTLNGLNRYNGYDVKIFRHKRDDRLSLPDNYISALLCDDNGRLWIAATKGLYQYDYSNDHFVLLPGSDSFRFVKLLQGAKGNVYAATAKGLVVFDTHPMTTTSLLQNNSAGTGFLLSQQVNDFCIAPGGLLYVATDSGLIVYNPTLQQAKLVLPAPVKDHRLRRVGVDSDENIWASYGEDGSRLLKTDKNFSGYTLYGSFFVSPDHLNDNQINSIFTDNKGRIWVSTSRTGLCLYRQAANDFISFRHDPLQSASLSGNLATGIFQDSEGYIWVGTEGYGVNYFHPDKAFFHTIQASFNQSPTLPDNWCRAVAEDKYGDLWLGTASGLARYSPQKNSYTLFQNTNKRKGILHYNSIRSLLCDDDEVWIGTGNGLNRYHISTGKMDFFSDRDSIPESFFWSIIKDYHNDIWFGSRDGLYKYDHAAKKMESIAANPLLAPYKGKNVTVIYEDSLRRLWIGFYRDGLLMYDPVHQLVKHWGQGDSDTSISNSLIESIAVDRKAIAWVGTQEGLNACDPQTGRVKQYREEAALSEEIISSLMVDDRNRIWMASGKGLYMLNAERTFFKSYGTKDDLPSADFNTQSACRTRAGEFVYPTLKGFVVFNPLLFSKENEVFNIYISSFKVFGKELIDTIGCEAISTLRLKQHQNFFSLLMTALNYVNPQQSWYAYRLEPFDKDWIYTKDRQANYTNVPGGDYVFHYKTSTDVSQWQVPEKTIRIHIDTMFFKTWWFALMLGLGTGLILYWVFRLRINRKERMHLLQTKAYSLEKEKAQVMYESLKQQLNPHFLFNSLTSLSSLITTNPPMAKRFLDSMSKIYRYILKSRDSELVPLEEELKLAGIYTQLQQTRFREGLQVNIEIAEEYHHRKIAPVTIQNLVENAIKHNVIDADTPLIINIIVENDYLVVQNNLQKKTFVETSNRQGLASMQSLYRYLSGKPLIVSEDKQFFTVKIPLL